MGNTGSGVVVVGNGQIGSQLVAQLASAGERVTVVSRTPTAQPAGAAHVARDLTKDALDDVMAGTRAVFFAVNAPYTAKVWAEVLPLMQRRVVEAAVRARTRLVVLENLYVHGPHAEPLREDMPFSTCSQKGAVRPPDFWGPALHGALLNDAGVRGVLQGKPVSAIGDVDAPHARAYAADVARAMITIAASEHAADWGRVWHPPVIHATTREMVTALARAAGVRDPGVRTLPRWAQRGLSLVVPFLREIEEMMYQWDRPYRVDDSAFRARFGWSATSLADGSAACVAAARAASPERKAA